MTPDEGRLLARAASALERMARALERIARSVEDPHVREGRDAQEDREADLEARA